MPISDLPKDPTRISHDQLFKELFQTFFRELFELFFPDAMKELLLDEAEFIDKEVLVDCPGGAPRRLDILARVPTTSHETRLILIHIEIQEQEDRDAEGKKLPFNERMARYYMALRLRRPEPILPVVFWFVPGKGTIGIDEHCETLFGEPVLTFRYRRVGVRDLDAEEYLTKPNPLAYGLASRMKRGRLGRAELKLRCVGQMGRARLTEGQRHLLLTIIHTYLKLNPVDERKYEAMLEQPEYEDVKETELTYAQELALKGEVKGRKEGVERGRKDMVRLAFSTRFGPMPEELSERLEAIHDPERLAEILTALLSAKDAAEAQTKLGALCNHS